MNNSFSLSVGSVGKFFYRLAEESQDVFWVRDKDFFTYQYVSPAFETVWGWPVACLKSGEVDWILTIHEEDRQRIAQEIDKLKAAAHAVESTLLEYRIIDRGLAVQHIQEITLPLYGANQVLLGFVGIAKNVTRDKTRLIELEQAALFFRYFSAKVRSAFWARDPTCDKQLYLSPGYEKIWERSRDYLYANPDSWIQSLHPDDREAFTKSARLRTLELMNGEAQYEDRYRIYTPDGRLKWIKDTSFSINDERNKFIGFAGIAEDVTNEVLHEQSLREAIARAEMANQAKSDFLAVISHELRTPLNAILGVTQILETKKLPLEIKEYVDYIKLAGNSLLSLVTDILDFARLEAGKLTFTSEQFQPDTLIEQTVKSMRIQAKEKGLVLNLVFLKQVSQSMLGDPNRIRQVIVNFLSNAIKCTDKGKIDIFVDCEKKTDTEMTLEVRVLDTGIGIQPDKLKTIFDKFNQVDSIYHRRVSGIGLGLAICKQLVETMGGHIWAKSTIGAGSEFGFTLPLLLQQQAALENQTKLNVRRQYGFSILLVEDNLINQKIATAMLEDFGCKVDVFGSGKEVMERLDQLKKYDLIFLDVGLPDMSGFDISERLRKETALKRTPIVALTAHILDRDRKQAMKVGMNHMVPKPITYEELSAVLAQYKK